MKYAMLQTFILKVLNYLLLCVSHRFMNVQTMANIIG